MSMFGKIMKRVGRAKQNNEYINISLTTLQLFYYRHQQMVKLIVEGQAYELDETTKNIMEMIAETEAIDGAKEQIVVTNINKQNFERVLEACKITKCNFEQVGKVKGSNPREYIGNDMSDFLDSLSNEQLNNLFKAAHALKLKRLANNIAAYLACRVYIPLNLEAYNKKKTELGVQNDLTPEISQMYKKKYFFY